MEFTDFSSLPTVPAGLPESTFAPNRIARSARTHARARTRTRIRVREGGAARRTASRRRLWNSGGGRSRRRRSAPYNGDHDVAVHVPYRSLQSLNGVRNVPKKAPRFNSRSNGHPGRAHSRAPFARAAARSRRNKGTFDTRDNIIFSSTPPLRPERAKKPPVIEKSCSAPRRHPRKKCEKGGSPRSPTMDLKKINKILQINDFH